MILREVRVGCVFPVGLAPRIGGNFSATAGRVNVMPLKYITPDIEFPNHALIPAPINAHLHLDLSHNTYIPPTPRDPTAWLRAVIGSRFSATPSEVREAAERASKRVAEFGTGAVGDISATPTEVPPLKGVRFREVLGLTPERADQTLAAATAREQHGPLAPGISPHAPYSTSVELYARCAELGLPLATHLGEFAEERELLEEQTGPFRDFLESMNLWHPGRLAKSWADVLKAVSSAPSVAIIHGNYLEPGPDWPANASLVYCPRTHAAFGHPPHPVRKFLDAGIAVGLGTDSLASNPDLDVLAEAYYLRQHRQDLSPKELLKMLTVHGARCLGLDYGPSNSYVLVPWEPGHRDPHDGLFLADVPRSTIDPASGLVVRGGPA